VVIRSVRRVGVGRLLLFILYMDIELLDMDPGLCVDGMNMEDTWIDGIYICIMYGRRHGC
jgi:hypothetical protein